VTIRMNGAMRLRLAGSALGGLIALAFVPAATAQWLPPAWRTASPGAIERSLEAQGYGLIAPLVRRPGVYLADVNAGPAGYQRLVVDARSGQILERFVAPGRRWGPMLDARNEEFGEPQPGAVGPLLNPGFSGLPAAAASPGTSAYGGPANLQIPAAVTPYGHGEAPLRTKAGAKAASIERKAPATKSTSSPPLPPPAPREAARPDGSGSPASEPGKAPESNLLKIDPHPIEVDNAPPAAASTIQASPAEGSGKSKVSIVPPALFE
jgi:hypothetical protein